MPDAARLAAILDRQPEPDRAVLLDALARGVARDVRRIERDAALRTMGLGLVGLSERKRAEAIQRELLRYGASNWLRDRELPAAPAAFDGTKRGLLFAAFRASAGDPPTGLSQLRAILRDGGRSEAVEIGHEA